MPASRRSGVTTRGCSVCRREKASKRFVRLAALSAACRMGANVPPDLGNAALVNPSLDQGQPADNDLNNVVKIMRDAPGELTDDFHFLRLDQALLARLERRVRLPQLRGRRKRQSDRQEAPQGDGGEDRDRGRDRLHDGFEAVGGKP